jgi:hypothetical protein
VRLSWPSGGEAPGRAQRCRRHTPLPTARPPRTGQSDAWRGVRRGHGCISAESALELCSWCAFSSYFWSLNHGGMTDFNTICTRPARPQVRFRSEAAMDRQVKPAGLVENDSHSQDPYATNLPTVFLRDGVDCGHRPREENREASRVCCALWRECHMAVRRAGSGGGEDVSHRDFISRPTRAARCSGCLVR